MTGGACDARLFPRELNRLQIARADLIESEASLARECQ
jgi:hypothetical protein